MNKNKEVKTCPRCYRVLPRSEFEKEICNRCDDVLEFGYPAFPAFKLDESDNQMEPKRMDLNEGWVLPSYLSK